MDKRLEMLRAVAGLTELDGAQLVGLSRVFEHHVYAEQPLCREGEPADRLWVLCAGEIDVVKNTANRGPFKVATLVPTTLVGHGGLLGAQTRTATLLARGQVEVLETTTEAIRGLLDSADIALASPVRRALIVAASRQLSLATEIVGRLAVDVGISEPADAEAKLLQAQHVG